MMLTAGMKVCRRGKAGSVGQLRLQHQKVEINFTDGDMVVLSMEEFRRETVEGDILPMVNAGDGSLRPLSDGWRQMESDQARQERQRREKILLHFNSLCADGVLIKDAVASVAEFCRTEEIGNPPCERTLRNWRCLAKDHESMLSPAWSRCGNRFQGPDEVLREVLAEVTNVTMMNNDRFTLTAAWDFVKARFDQEWRKRKGDAPKPRHSSRKLKNFLKAMPWADVLKLRLDPRTARAMTRTAVRTHEPGIFWECVEIDAAFLNVFVRNEHGDEIGRPVLYVAVDTGTGYPVGFELTVQKPSALPFVDCLRFMYFPKPEGFDKKYGIKNRIEVFGKPVTARVDNGSEFIGKVATNVVRHLYGDSARCKPMTPQEKPFVERFIGILKNYILTLPGATTSSVNGEQRLPKRGEVLLTMDELRGRIYRFAYDSYALMPNDLRSKRHRKAVAPLDIWKEMDVTFTQPVPVSREEFEVSLAYSRAERRLAHDGISFDGLNYHSNELAALFQKHGPGKYEFLYTELDVKTIYVVSPNGGALVPAFEKVLEGSIVDRSTARTIKKEIQAQNEILTSRTFEHKLAEFNAAKSKLTSSRSRAKQARVGDMLQKASDHARMSEPKHDPPVANASHQPLVVRLDSGQEAPRGRKKGALQ